MIWIILPDESPKSSPGADGAFTLYDDAGDGYGYEQGEYARIPMVWKDETGQLTIGERMGSYPGMSATCIFHVHTPVEKSVEILYNGQAITVQLQKG